MSAPLKAAVLAAARRLLEPLARLLLEAGIGVGEFHVLAKRAFVRAACDLGSQAHRPNVSRIALLTGMRRPEVTEFLESPDDAAPDPHRGGHRAERVLAAWWSDPDFQDEDGRPAHLALRGRRSFAALVKRYSGEPRVITLLDELVRVRAVRRLPDGRLEALSRTYATARWDPQGVAAIGERVRDHLQTLLHNIRHPNRPRYERLVVNTQLDERYGPMLTRDLASQADTLADALEDALNDPKATVKPGAVAKNALRLGVAIYVFEEPVVVEVDASGAGKRRGTRKRRRP